MSDDIEYYIIKNSSDIVVDKYRCIKDRIDTVNFKNITTDDSIYPFYIDMDMDKYVTKTHIYNSSVDIPLHKVWLKINKVKIFNILKLPDNNKKMIILFSPLNKKTKKLLDLIISIEKHINNKINSQYNICSPLKMIDEYMAIMIIDIPMNNDSYNFKIFNNDNDEINSIQINDNIGLYMELDSIWDDDVQIGYNWKVLQIKVYKNISFDTCRFDMHKNTTTPKTEPVKIIIPNKSSYKIKETSAYKIKEPIIDNIPQPKIKINQPPKFAPSLKDILETKKKLKKIRHA